MLFCLEFSDSLCSENFLINFNIIITFLKSVILSSRSVASVVSGVFVDA